ncbi:hypothetical protein FRC14_003849 [Serendipita sp. 396]|nr:hypothetical protein FRC14_003849 [Serendipita sp. 396]KAG8789454.1 hypothetical protein FRC15_008311 [Serendipita sp. 397]KAG8804685.1 hypothetical protein FRC16_003575 [Serendipita sp. 398]KAG8835902.1 hypothetical protein FRC18_012197 [Serendipita sp. 400]KAG8879041.1 hypothetical protein FRC20_003800 [Serendipita sp. 405]
MPTTSQIITIGTVAVVLGIAGYAVYFDYVRRNDPQFRKKLRKEKKRIDRSNSSIKAATASAKGLPTDAELDAALQLVRSEDLPSTAEEKEQYFMQNLAIGEQLSTQGLALPAALAFFRAMRVYPEPMQLVLILEKTLPEDMFRIVMDLMSRDIKHKGDVYYDFFPPKAMNVKVKLAPVGSKGGDHIPLQRTILVATKDFRAGETIFTEKPIVACLDADLIGSSEYCAYCLRVITSKGSCIKPPLDPFQSNYCSTGCQRSAEEQYQDLLFGAVPPATPANPFPNRTKAIVEERRAAQESFVNLIKHGGKTSPLLILRFIGQLVADEHRRLLSSELKNDLPDVDPESKLTYSAHDHVERLRSIETQAGIQEDEEISQCRNLLKLAVDGLEAFLDDTKYMLLKGKLAYNCYGVTYGLGRTDKPYSEGAFERTRASHGPIHQIGSAFFRVASYINHSCLPSARAEFEGTSEIHIVAINDIKAGDEITVSYVDTKRRSKDKNATDARKHRRQELARGWGFACDCVKCAEETAILQLDGEEDSSMPVQETKLDPAFERYLAKNT